VEQPAGLELLPDGVRWTDLPLPAGPAEQHLAVRAPLPLDLPPWPTRPGAVAAALPDSPARITVIAPVVNAAADLVRCLDSLLEHTTAPARLLLIDDASTDPAIRPLLARVATILGVAMHRNLRHLGFTATVNRGIALAAPDDVVLLNADTMVGPAWLEVLRLAAASDPRTGAVTSVSNHAGAYSVPELGIDNPPPTPCA
jgi:cellulose synthase/poly-beta-1,6-N-acetylglucosamine synthase-like glycosyltransferase